MNRLWTLTFHVNCDAEEAERIFDAMHVVACDCADDPDRECRCPVSGMRPWAPEPPEARP
jgi:hypothetical protein